MDCTKEAKCQQTPTKGESEAKATSLKGCDRRLLLGVCISQSQSNHVLCVRVYTTWKYKFFQGPLPPKTPIFFFKRQRERKSVFVPFFFFLPRTNIGNIEAI